MAGKTLDFFSHNIRTGLLGSGPTSVNQKLVTARVMPNIGMRVGAGCTASASFGLFGLLVYTMGGSEVVEHEENLVKIFGSVGQCYKVPEVQINAYCGLFASGIGFMFPVLESLSDGAVAMGVPRDLSLKIAAQTMKGAAELVLVEGAHPGMLKDSICSPGGTTIAGIVELEKYGIRNAVISAIIAATKRGEELGALDSTCPKIGILKDLPQPTPYAL